VLDAVIFDLGGVVLRWEPERAFEQVLPSDDVPGFLERIDFHGWNRRNDSGYPFEAAEAELIERFPGDALAIRAYRTHFGQTLTGMVPGTSAVIADLGQAGVRLSALTNWSGETFPHARARYGILRRFDDVVVSGDEGLLKPDPAIYELACARSGFEPASTVFVDDSAPNVAAAESFGLTAVHFTDAEALRAALESYGLLEPAERLDEPVFHWSLREQWDAAVAAGAYPWSSRHRSYDAEGFVHCSFPGQIQSTRERHYGDLADGDLVLLELDPARLELPIVVEPGGTGEGFPHLFCPLPPAGAVSHPAQWRP
jgi:2-haloacid dehalogenase